MVAEPIYYFRFDVKEWLNTDTYTVEKFLDYVDRYYMSDDVVQYKITEDVDFQPDSITVWVTKAFFANPKNDPMYENAVDDKNAFSPQLNHIIVIGPMVNVNNKNIYNEKLVFGIVQNATEENGDKVKVTCKGLIKNISDMQSGTEYNFDVETAINGYIFDSQWYLPDDNPCGTQLYFNDADYKTREELDQVSYWKRKNRSDPAFPDMSLGSNKLYPYAIYSLSGRAKTNGSILINIPRAEDESVCEPYTIPFKVGDKAEVVLSRMLQHDLNWNVNRTTVPELYLSTGSENILDLSVKLTSEILRMTQHNDCLVVQSLITMIDGDKQYYLREVQTNENPIVVPEGSGFTADYVYFGKTDSVSATTTGSVTSSPPDDGRPKIANSDTNIDLSEQESPFYPLDTFGFEQIEGANGPITKRYQYFGYSLSKLAWRLLQDVGWCRYPYFPDCNPYNVDYDANSNPIQYDTYDVDGLLMSFPERLMEDKKSHHYLPYYTAFDCSKQSYAYNLKTLSDAQSMFLNAGLRPKLDNYVPVWDADIYNRPTSCSFEVEGYVPDDLLILSVYIPVLVNGTVINREFELASLDSLTRREIAAKLEKMLRDDEDISSQYDIVRFGSKVYVQTYLQAIAQAIRDHPSTVNFDTNSESIEINKNVCRILYKAEIARTDAKERQAERIYYLRRWGIVPGFHPKLFIRPAPNELSVEPELDYSFEYTGSDTDTTDATKISIAAKPKWGTDSKDIINKAVVKFTSTDPDATIDSYVVFPANSKQYKYFSLHLKGLTTDVANAQLSLTFKLNGDEWVGSVTTRLDSGMSADVAASTFDRRVIVAKPIDDTIKEFPTYQFPVSSSGAYIFVYSDFYTNNLFVDTSQVTFSIVKEGGDGSETAPLYNDKKELVQEEPTSFNDARNSQSKNGIKQVSLTLPESKSINDTMNFVAHIFEKYQNPKDTCTVQLTQPDGWHIPLFSYVEIKDSANSDITSEDVPWYATAVITETSKQDQNIIMSFSYDDGTYESLKIPILNGDTPTVIASKIAAMADADDGNELTNFHITTNGGYIKLIPKINYGEDDIGLYPTPPELASDFVDTSYLDAATSGNVGGGSSGGSSGGDNGGTTPPVASTSKIKVTNGVLTDQSGTALGQLRGVNDTSTMGNILQCRGTVSSSGIINAETYGQSIDTGSVEEIAKFFYRYGRSLKEDSYHFNLLRIGFHDHWGTDKAWTTYAYDKANGTKYLDTLLEGMCKGMEAAGIYYSIGPWAGFSDTVSGQQWFYSRTLSNSKTAIGSLFTAGSSMDSTYVDNNLLNKDSDSFTLFAEMVTHVCNVVGDYPHLIGVEFCNEPDLGCHKDKWWYAKYGGSDPNTAQSKAQAAYKAWLTALYTKVKTDSTKKCLLFNGSTPFDIQNKGWKVNGSAYDRSGSVANVLDMNGACDIIGLHMYHIPIELTQYVDGSGAVKEGWDYYLAHMTDYTDVPEERINSKVYFQALVTAAKAMGKPVFNDEWGSYLGSTQIWVQHRADEMEGITGMLHACIVPRPGWTDKVVINTTYALPEGWDTDPTPTT